MKRSLALVLTIAIFAAIAVCFLRPAYPDWFFKVDGGTVRIVARPVDWEIEVVDIHDIVGGQIELEGESDLIQLEIERFDVINENSLVLAARTTAESREFTVGARIVKQGNLRVLPEGYMQRIDGGREGERKRFAAKSGFFINYTYRDGVYVELIGEDKPLGIDFVLPFDEIGRYRVVLQFYEWDSETRTLLSEEPYEVSFELEYKAPKDDDIAVYGAFIDNDRSISHGKRGIVDYREITLLLRRKEREYLQYMHLYDVVAERKVDGRWINCDEIVFNTGNGAGYYRNSAYYVGLEKELEPGDYRLTLLFTESWTTEEVVFAPTLCLHIDG